MTLVEKVAILFPHGLECDDCHRAARTAIAVVLEAKAEMADEMAASPPGNDARHPDWQMGYQDALMEFAAILRERQHGMEG